jgi:ubiquinone/menaquinone biosynthesis C-methylase UbiE
MRKNIEHLYNKYYPVKKDHFLDCIVRHMRIGCIMVDAGCGNGSQYIYSLKDRAKEIIGIDEVDDLIPNKNVTVRLRGNLEDIPLSNESVDLIISRYVFEHIRDMGHILKEFKRILKPQGKVIFRTPNRFNYVYLIAALTPHKFHLYCNKIRSGSQMREEDTFPTYYKFNSAKAIRNNAKKAALTVKELHFIEPPPAYLVFSSLLFRLGVLYERLVNSVSAFDFLRGTIVGVLVKV